MKPTPNENRCNMYVGTTFLHTQVLEIEKLCLKEKFDKSMRKQKKEVLAG